MVNTGTDLNQPIMRDSAPTDDPFGDQKSNKVPVQECQHFSIREFVADIRKRDPKLCDPFSSYVSLDGSTDFKHKPPSTELPKFRWPQCGSSAPGPSSSSRTSKAAQKSTAEVADVPMPLIEEPSKVVDAPKEWSIEAGIFADSNDNKNCNLSTISADAKGKGKAHVENELAPQTGFNIGLVNESSSQGILRQTSTDGKEADEVVVRARSVANERSTKSHHHKNRNSTGIVIGYHRKCVNREKGNNANEISLMTKQASLEAQQAGIFHGSDFGSSSGSKARLVPLPDLNEFSEQPLEDDNNKALVTGNNNLMKDNDEYFGADRRKTSKVRLLSELLGLKENPNDAKRNKKNSSSSSFPSPSCYKSMSFDPPSQSPVNENGKRKRSSFDLDEESKSLEIKSRLHVVISDSESESEDEVIEITSEAFTKRCSRSSLGNNLLVEKRNGKKVKIDHGASSSMSQQKIIPKSSSHEKGKSCDKRVTTDAMTVKIPRVIDLPQNIDVAHPVPFPYYGDSMQQRGTTSKVSPFEEMVAKQKRLGPFTDFNRNLYSIGGWAQGQEHVSPSPIIGLPPNNINWNRHIDFRSYFPSYLEAMDLYNRHRGCSPRQNMDPRVWPSVAGPSRTPMGITNQEMISQSSSVLNRGTRGPAIFNHGKTTNLSSSDGACNAGLVDKSVNLYSSRAVSAMRFLNMMQNAAAKRAPLHPDLQPYKQYCHNPGSQKTGSSSSRQPLIENNSHLVGDSIRKPPLALFLDKDKGMSVPGSSRPSSIINRFATTPTTKDSQQKFPYKVGIRSQKIVLPTPNIDICTMNRNPSELSDPEELSLYMIGPEELTRSKRLTGQEKAARPRAN